MKMSPYFLSNAFLQVSNAIGKITLRGCATDLRTEAIAAKM